MTKKQIKKRKRNELIYNEYLNREATSKTVEDIQKETNHKYNCDLNLRMIYKILKKMKNEKII